MKLIESLKSALRRYSPPSREEFYSFGLSNNVSPRHMEAYYQSCRNRRWRNNGKPIDWKACLMKQPRMQKFPEALMQGGIQ